VMGGTLTIETSWKYIFRVLLWSAFSILLLAALYVSVGRIFLGGLSDLKPTLENYFSSSLGAEVSITNIWGEFIGLDPHIRISGLAIADPGGGAYSRIDSMTVVVDSLACLKNLTLSLDRLQISGLRTSVKQLETGGWKVAGLPKRDEPAQLTPIVDFLTNINSLTFSDIEVNLQTLQNTLLLYLPEGKNTELITQGGLRRISANLNYRLDPQQSSEVKTGSLELIGEFKGNPLADDDFYSNAFLQISPIPLLDLLPTVRMKDLNLSALSAGGKFWLEVDKGEFLLQGELSVPALSFSKELDRRDVITELQASFQFEGVGLWDWRLTTNDVRFGQQGAQRNIDNIKVTSFIDNDQRHLVGSIGKLDMGSVSDSLLKFSENSNLLPVRTRAMFETMQPQGALENVHFKLHLDKDPIDARLVARISNTQIKAYLGSPALSQLDGFISAGPKNGWLDIHSKDFNIRFETAFNDDWHFDSGTARVRYEYEPGLLKLNSDLIRFSERGMTVNGSFQINLPRDRLVQTWGLVIGITNADLSEKLRYLPFTISEQAYEWLDRAVVSGHVIDGGLMFHGILGKEAPAIEKAYELYFNVEDSILDYDPQWPQVSDMIGKIYLGNWGASATGMQARIYSSQVTKADVQVPFDELGRTSVVEILGDLTGSASDGIRFLTETPLQDQVNNLADDWVAKGDIKVRADLVIPIREVGQNSAEDSETDSSISIVMNGNEILMPSYDIRLEDIKGELSYSEEGGLNSQAFTARLFDRPMDGQIATAIGEFDEVTISVHGSITVEDLYNWSQQTILTRARGEFDYSAELKIPIGSQLHTNSLQAISDLAGVSVDLPHPLGKTAGESREFSYLTTFGDSAQEVAQEPVQEPTQNPFQRVEVDYGEDFSAALVLKDTKVVGGLVNFGEVKEEVSESSGVIVKGYLAKVDLEEWESLIDDLQSKYMAMSDVSLETEISKSIELIYLDIGQLNAYGRELIDVRSQLSRGRQGWEIDIVNPILGGQFILPDERNQPLIVDLNYINIDSNEEKEGREDPLLQINPELVGALVFSTDEFNWDGENYGSWSFKFNPTDDGALISNLSATLKGLKILSEEEQQSSITWTKKGEEHHSHFEGFVHSSDLAKVLEEWGFASSIESQDVGLDAQLDWKGSPAMFSYETVTGLVKVKAGEGRFVQVQSGSGALQLLGIFDFASIARRLSFDFSDIVDSGFQFDEIKGKAFLEDGIVKVVEPIEIDSPSSILKVGGEVNLINKGVDGDMIVTLPVNRNLPWFAAIASGPLFGAGVFLAQKILLDEPIKQFSSAKYKVSGSIDEPVIEFISIFDNSVRQRDELEPVKSDPVDSR